MSSNKILVIRKLLDVERRLAGVIANGIAASTGASVVFDTVAPADTDAIWVNENDFGIYVYYDDGISAQWIEVGDGEGVTLHALLAGLNTDDHALYALADGTRGAFATEAQGALASTAVQPGDLAAVATSGDYNDLANTPSGGGGISTARRWVLV